MAPRLAFGPFCIDLDAGTLFHDGEPTPLGQRAVALLVPLLRRAGAPVSKVDLFEAAWPSQAVEDSNLTVQIAAARKMLDERAGAGAWIETLPRRGYRYVGPPVAVVEGTFPIHAPPDGPSVAVLPFANLSGDASQDYFADGMVDDIVTGLARVKWLFVIARNSTFAYKGRAIDVKQVGRELGVRYVVEGSVRRADRRVRVTCQMVDATTGAHVWAERYDRDSDDVFALQDDIARSVVGAMAPSLRRAEVERVKRRRAESLDAYDLVLRAQADVDSGMPVRVSRALGPLERAIELDPGYALAYGNAAMCHHCLFLRAGFSEAHRSASIRHARAAMLHGQDDATAMTLAGFSLGMDGHDRAAAFVALEAALEISPSSALTYILGAVMLGWGGEAERAIAWSERGMRLSPFDPWAFAAYDAQAMSMLLLGRDEDACRSARKAVRANPEHSIAYVQLTAALSHMGRMADAKAAAARVLELQPAFRFGRQFAGVDCAPALAEIMGDALRAAGLPE